MSYSGYDGGQGGGYDGGQGGGYDGGQTGGHSSYGGYSEANYPHTPQQREGSHTPHSFYDPNQYSAPAPQQHQGGGYGGHPGGHLPPGGQHGAYLNGAANQAPSQFNNPSQFLQENFNLNPMMTGMAEDYTRKIADEGMAKAKTTVEKYVSIGQLKYYFAVDNSYVTRKLSLILFPFFHKDWSIRYNQDEPVQPRYELNAADLYIPIMAFLTYILVVGYVLLAGLVDSGDHGDLPDHDHHVHQDHPGQVGLPGILDVQVRGDDSVHGGRPAAVHQGLLQRPPLLHDRPRPVLVQNSSPPGGA